VAGSRSPRGKQARFVAQFPPGRSQQQASSEHRAGWSRPGICRCQRPVEIPPFCPSMHCLPFFVIRNDSFCHFSAKIKYNARFTVVYILLLRPIPISGLKGYLRHYGEVAGNLHIELANPLFDLLLKLANNQRVKEFQRKRDFQKCANKKVFRSSNF
jgi:hypothetical protein